MSNVTSEFHANTFIWNIKKFGGFDDNCYTTEHSSDVFQFCGYFCYLVIKHDEYDTEEGDDADAITLYGYPAPYKKNISCHYSICMKVVNSPYFATNSGEMRTEEEKLKFVLLLDSSHIFYGQRKSLKICFSWSEDKCKALLSQAVQTDSVRSHMIEQEAQTEETQIPPMRNVCTHADRGSNKFLEILSKDLSSFYENKTDPDCVLKVGETKFPVHRSVLSSRSTVFAAMFHHDTSESQCGEVNILDVDAGALGDILYYIYAGKIRGLCPETAVSMYVLSDKYALIDLREECLFFLTNNLTIENICDAALLAHTHAETDLENKVLQFIEGRLEELMQNDKWKKFSDTHFKLANFLLCSAFLSTKNKLMKISSNV